MPELLTSIHFQFLSPLHQFWDPLLSLTNKYGGGQSHTTLTSSTKSSSYQLIGYHSNYIQGKFGVQHCKLSIKQLIETHDVCSTCIHLYFSAVEHLLPELVGGKVYVFKYMQHIQRFDKSIYIHIKHTIVTNTLIEQPIWCSLNETISVWINYILVHNYCTVVYSGKFW